MLMVNLFVNSFTILMIFSNQSLVLEEKVMKCNVSIQSMARMIEKQTENINNPPHYYAYYNNTYHKHIISHSPFSVPLQITPAFQFGGFCKAV